MVEAFSVERSEVSVADDARDICLFDVVVRISRELRVRGRRSEMAEVRSHTVAEEERGIQRVVGRPRPGKEESRTLMVGNVMAARCRTVGIPWLDSYEDISLPDLCYTMER